jgi:uncharacterized sporulation protein YeaH/YhbH (DUF444 family)
MPVIIDRRKNAKGKTIRNRQRFLDLHKRQIKDGVKRILDGSGVENLSSKNKKVIVKPLTQPTFRNDPKSGNREYVLPGNKDFITGDKHAKPPVEDGGGAGEGEGSMHGEGDDAFEFTLTEAEFMDYVFDHLELPDMVKKQLKTAKQFDRQRAGYKTTGTPSQMDIRKSITNSIGRRIALKRPSEEYIQDLKAMLAPGHEDDPAERRRLSELLEEAERKFRAIPFFDTFDVRYKNTEFIPKPRTRAVMFCVMDVSYSMTEERKQMAKSFYMLLNLFLKRKYEHVDVRFVSHHTEAKEVLEEEFFHSTVTGGTVVSTAFDVTLDIIKSDYNLAEWNIYVAQASDGDNASDDMPDMMESFSKLIELTQYFAYIQTRETVNPDHYYGYTASETAIWKFYEPLLAKEPKLNIKAVSSPKDVWKVFSQLFAKENNRDATIQK